MPNIPSQRRVVASSRGEPADGKIYPLAFRGHVDHRLPIQKLMQVEVLKLSGFDFGTLVAVNYAVAALLAVVAMAAARAYRGYSSVGDLLIPACRPERGHRPFAMGIRLSATLRSFLCNGISLSRCVLRSQATAGTSDAGNCRVAPLRRLCGLGGLVISSTLTLVVAATFYHDWRANGRRRSVAACVALGLCGAVNAALWFTWSPSSASSTTAFSLPVAADYLFGLVNSSLVVYAFVNANVKFAVLAALFAAGLAFGTYSIWRSRGRSLAETYMIGALVATLLLMLAIALGRSRYQPWAPGLEMHYGYLTILAPITSWLLVSARIGRTARTVLGLVLLAMFARAYQANWDWRSGFGNRTRSSDSRRADRPRVRARSANRGGETHLAVLLRRHTG